MRMDFENMNMYAVSSPHPVTFLIQCIRNVFTKMMFSNSLGDHTSVCQASSRILIRFFGLQLLSTCSSYCIDPVE